MKNSDFIYCTFTDYWEIKWFIICDQDGNPITNILDAQKFMRLNYSDRYWGIAEHDQMLLGNAQIDNF